MCLADIAVVGTDLAVHPAASGFLILRYTIGAGEGGEATISGSFRDHINYDVGDSVAVFVYHNNAQLWNAVGTGPTLTQANGTFGLSRTVAEGDTIDFVVSMNVVNPYGDETAVRGAIEVTPPSTGTVISTR